MMDARPFFDKLQESLAALFFSTSEVLLGAARILGVA